MKKGVPSSFLANLFKLFDSDMPEQAFQWTDWRDRTVKVPEWRGLYKDAWSMSFGQHLAGASEKELSSESYYDPPNT